MGGVACAPRVSPCRRFPNTTTLQEFYDSGAGQFIPDLPRPLTPSGFSWLTNWVTKLVTEFPKSGFAPQLNVTDPQVG